MKKLLLTTAMVLALGAGHALAEPDAPPPGDHHAQRFEQTLSQLPKDKADLIRNDFNQARAQNEPFHAQLESLHKERIALLSADKFDKKAYLANIRKTQKLHDTMQMNRTEAFASALTKLTAPERKILVDSMHEMDEHFAGPHHSGDAPPKP